MGQLQDAAGSSPLARGLPRRVRPPPSGRADHPRSRGVYRAARAPQRRAVGSSPLARGLPVDAQVAGDLCRIIPARAGFTGVAGCLLGVDADHPRSRGVYPEGGGRTRRAQGSSPLARGLLSRLPPMLVWLRIIPARAGFTGFGVGRRGYRGDHPRSRGVYWSGPVWWFIWWGSSPLARGLRTSALVHAGAPRIIPARAGFTYIRYPSVLCRADHPRSRGVYCTKIERMTGPGWIIPARAGFTVLDPRNIVSDPDHPRSRGVYFRSASNSAMRLGSSPLARGLLGCRRGGPHQNGIIPARAGFTEGLPCIMVGSTDHPRSRGVYDRATIVNAVNRGSSPLARGLLGAIRHKRVVRRIIPARAGFTRCRKGAHRPHQDHPRSRGVYIPIRQNEPRATGSSPLARGLHTESRRLDHHARIIPARAGFTVNTAWPALQAADHPRSRGVYTLAPVGQKSSSWIIPARAGFTAES